ncbi:probable inactive receptor kinase At2g26730 [Impatiens glandulifera]|uniref:probable inactive receptor kinase At2g26730 n=1 Tax=Impatiens glandulifera TaxID=253017 RepID=UPI001FB08515|nr:probable inactive receptor kinase At2g26730 [Impatiens glandulifera]
MNRFAKWVCLFSLFFLVTTTRSNEQEDGKTSLLNFVTKLSNGNINILGWNLSSDPCNDGWNGIKCDAQNITIKKILLQDRTFNGTFDAYLLCNPSSLANSLIEINLNNNTLTGENLDQIHNCKQLLRLHVGSNKFTGTIPESFSTLKNLVWLDLSENGFIGLLPNLSGISCLQVFLANGNHFTGGIPFSDFSNFQIFNVSFNNLSGKVPDGANGSKYSTSFISNPGLCGDPLPNKCPSPPVSSPENNQPQNQKSKNVTSHILMYSGYFLIGLAIIIILVLVKLCKRRNKQEQEQRDSKRAASVSDDSHVMKPSETSGLSLSKTGYSKSEFSVADESGAMMSSSMIIMSSPIVNGLRFDDLLKAPAELLGRGKHGSVYMVTCDGGIELVVKRVKDWTINGNDFRRRMKRLGEVKHPNVLSAMAYYSCRQEKLLVYEYQQNGSLFRLLHGEKRSKSLDWSSRLNMAAAIGDALAFMHRELHRDGIAHGNLKSSNILLKKNMEPCISEYGLMEELEQSRGINTFKGDVYSFGVIILELLTGRIGQANGVDLATWVVSVLREEWTAEVFDRGLMQEGASEERMVNMLQIGIMCLNETEEARPSIGQVALMINGLKEEDERSMISEPSI